MFANKVGEKLDTFFGMEIEDFDATLSQPVDAAAKVHRLSNDNGQDSKLANQAAAIPAGCQRRDHDFVAIASLASGAAECIGFAVNGRIILLNTAVMAATKQLTIAGKERGAYRYATLREALAGFRDGDLQHGVIIGDLFAIHPG